MLQIAAQVVIAVIVVGVVWDCWTKRDCDDIGSYEL